MIAEAEDMDNNLKPETTEQGRIPGNTKKRVNHDPKRSKTKGTRKKKLIPRNNTQKIKEHGSIRNQRTETRIKGSSVDTFGDPRLELLAPPPHVK